MKLLCGWTAALWVQKFSAGLLLCVKTLIVHVIARKRLSDKSIKSEEQSHTHIIKVDNHGAVAHVCRFVVGLAADREGHSAGAGADGHAQSVTGRLRRRSGVTHNQAFPLEDDGFCVILAPALQRSPKQEHTQHDCEVKVDWPEIHDLDEPGIFR